MFCQGVCHLFKGGFKYSNGDRYCSTCGIFIRKEKQLGNRCPCCGYKMRMKSKNYSPEKARKRKCRGLESKRKITLESDQKSESRDPKSQVNLGLKNLTDVPSVEKTQLEQLHREDRASDCVSYMLSNSRDGLKDSL